MLTASAGPVTTNGVLLQALQRRYNRFDEAGREYQSVQDIDLATNERLAIDPTAGTNSSLQTVFDSGSRVQQRRDANGNITVRRMTQPTVR